MAFRKFANAAIVKPDITSTGWEDVRARGGKQASKVVLDKIDPGQFMLTHCTIIASVDTETSTEALGRQMIDGFEVDRRYADWLVTPQTTKYINNNNDCWERKLLLACFRTFVGGENYVEHVQIPELSKGKILDAAARDIGDSIYVDILIATDRKFRPLISSIQRKELKTLSMGCQVEFTICTACGNVAYDETQLCNHIRYFKGNEFVDSMGRKRKIAELCGHVLAEPGSVKFIEASWVANPAFEGAVLRDILNPEEVAGVGKKMSLAFSQGPRIVMPGAMGKAASFVAGAQQEGGFDDGMSDQGAPTPAPEPKGDSMDKAVDEVADIIRQRAVEKVRGEMGDKTPRPNENRNDNLIKEALRYPAWRMLARRVHAATGKNVPATRNLLIGLIHYKHGGWSAVREARVLSGRDILALSRFLEGTNKTAMAGEGRLYRAVIAAGPLTSYPNEGAFLGVCQKQIGRTLTATEKESLLDKGRLFAMGVNNPSLTPQMARNGA